MTVPLARGDYLLLGCHCISCEQRGKGEGAWAKGR